MPVVEMLISIGLRSGEILVGKASRMVREASRQIVLSWIPIGLTMLGRR